MRKLVLSAGVLMLLSISMVSCKKDYVCKCSKTYTSGSGTSTSDYASYTYRENRKRAEDRCNENVSSGTDVFGAYSINCQIY